MANLRTFLTLSTVHLTPEVSALLDEMGEDVSTRGHRFDDWRDQITRCGFAYGHWVRVRRPDPSDQEDAIGPWLAELPDCLADCIRAAMQFGSAYLLFDSDEEPLGSLRQYGW